jgi:nitrite reductase (NADH) small subunit
MPEFEFVCHTTDIAEGEAKSFNIMGKMIGVYHLPDGFYAIDDPCPHAGASLVRGCIEKDVIHCRIHCWGFGIKDGQCREKNIPQHNVNTYKVQVLDDELSVSTTPSTT